MPDGTNGFVVTLEDVVETLIGMEIVDEADAVPDMRELARVQWERRAEKMGIAIANEGDEAAGSAGSAGSANAEG